MLCASTFSTLLEASRPAMPLASAGNTGRSSIPPGRQLSPLHLIDLVRELGVGSPVGREQLRPPAPGGRAARSDAGREVLAHAVGDQELRVLRPAVAALGEADLVGAERLAVGRGACPACGGTP